MTDMTTTTDNTNNLLTYTYDTDNLNKVSIKTFSSMDGSVQYNTVIKSAASFLKLNSVFDNELSSHSKIYNIGHRLV